MTLDADRQELADLIEGATGLPTWPYVPEALDASNGAVVLESGDPYLSPSQTFARGEVVMTLSAYVLVEYRADNESVTTDLNQHLTAVLTHLPRGWHLTGSDKPDVTAYGEWVHYGVRLSLSTVTTIT